MADSLPRDSDSQQQHPTDDANGIDNPKKTMTTKTTTTTTISFPPASHRPSQLQSQRDHRRKSTLPFSRSTRQKPRRWPLVLRFIKGAIHGAILLPVLLHTLVAALIAFVDQNLDFQLGLPVSIIPSLSIVVGLMLVFRNQTSYDRFWTGRNLLTQMITTVRNLTRSFLICSSLYPPPSQRKEGSTKHPPIASIRDTDAMVCVLLAILYASKHHLRASWGATTLITDTPASPSAPPNGHVSKNFKERTYEYEINTSEYADLLPTHFRGLLSSDPFSTSTSGGVGLPLQLTFFIEGYIKRNTDNGAFSAPQASQLTVQLNSLVDAYSRMETIRLTGIPVAILIHQKQVLALFGCLLPFALVDDMGWWAVPIVTVVCFALYGIDGIARQLEDPFGFDRNDIKVDVLVEDLREEIVGLLDEWRRVVGWEAGGAGAEPGTTGENESLDADQTTKQREMFIVPPAEMKNGVSMEERSGLRARFRDSVDG